MKLKQWAMAGLLAVFLSKSTDRVSLTLTAAGDCTLGSDLRWGYWNSFLMEYDRQQDPEYFLQNTREIFQASDLALANLEGPLTTAEAFEEKEFVFKGPPEFAEILAQGGVDAVNLANNHTYDYGPAGYRDTQDALAAAGVGYFGNGATLLREVKGVPVGLLGYRIWDAGSGNKQRVAEAVKALRAAGARLVVAFFHWGTEGDFYPNAAQKEMGRFAVDCGADLVLGSHPHVIQGVEVYRGRNIVYSLGNFCYGGSRYLQDKDTFIFRQTFTFWGGTLLRDNASEILPVTISSLGERNNFQPTPATGPDAERILGRMEAYGRIEKPEGEEEE
jgi:poly-gamma-glutamate synthesis protein (capsule biosynthesis protein)